LMATHPVPIERLLRKAYLRRMESMSMEAKLRFSLADLLGKVVSMGDATATLGADSLILTPVSGGPLNLSLRDFSSIEEGEYRISIQLRPSGSLLLFNAGFKYEDLVRSLFRAVNELELKDLLMDERLLKQGVAADGTYVTSTRRSLGRCEVRLYETAIVVMPERIGLLRLKFRDVLGTDVEDLRLHVKLESGETLELEKLGRELDPLRKMLSDSVSDLSAKAQAMVKDAHPSADLASVLRASHLLKDGKTAKRQDLEQACTGLWTALEKKLSGYGIGEEYAFLKGISNPDLVRIGIKRPLHAEEAQDYVFFLAPIFSTDDKKGGNALAFEASSGEDEGRATYFFRIWSRRDYPLSDAKVMELQADHFTQELAEGLNAINFRREPIYLTEEALNAPERSRYRYAIMRLPQLRLLRERFIGKVMHSSPEQWREDVASLLTFNVTQKEDIATWKKADEGP
jgi:hypothetical protein